MGYLKKLSMNQNTRLCTHNCANDSMKKHQISMRKFPKRRVHLEDFCSTNAEMNLKTETQSLSNMRTAWARRQRKMKRRPNTWLKGKCLAISNSSVNSENFKLFMTQSYTDAVNSCWSAAKNSLFPTRRKISS